MVPDKLSPVLEGGGGHLISPDFLSKFIRNIELGEDASSESEGESEGEGESEELVLRKRAIEAVNKTGDWKTHKKEMEAIKKWKETGDKTDLEKIYKERETEKFNPKSKYQISTKKPRN